MTISGFLTAKMGEILEAGDRIELEGVIADVLGVNADCVNVKVTSTDRLGAIGRGEGIAAQVVALLDNANG